MAIQGTVQVAGPVAPTSHSDVYATHHAEWGKGGHRTVQSLTDRDAITTERREEGMTVFVIDEQNTYKLKGGTTNAFWVIENGTAGKDGKSAYEIAKDNGYTDTEGNWLLSLKGQDGQPIVLKKGTATTLPEGSAATFAVRPDPNNPLTFYLDLSVPKGDTGESAIAATNPRGVYDPAETYMKNDYIVGPSGSTYVCKVDNLVGQEPTTGLQDDPNWQLFSPKGAKGDKGDDGDPGDDGYVPDIEITLTIIEPTKPSECIRSIDPVTNKITYNFRLAIPEGSGGDAIYTSTVPTTVKVGGVDKGSTFPNGIKTTELLDRILHEYIRPTFSAFALRNQSSTVEVGATVPAGLSFTFSTTSTSEIKPDSMKVTDVTNNTEIASGFNNTSPVSTSSSAITKSTAGTHTFRITGTNTKDEEFTKDVSISWRYKLFYGEKVETSLDDSGVNGLRVGSLSSGFANTYSFSAGGYKYLAYPSSFGTATSFKDTATNLDVPFNAPEKVTVNNINGVSCEYNVHRTKYELGGAINIKVS